MLLGIAFWKFLYVYIYFKAHIYSSKIGMDDDIGFEDISLNQTDDVPLYGIWLGDFCIMYVKF